MQEQDKSSVLQEVKVKGNQLVDKVREIIEEGNARRVAIRKDDRTLLEFPLSVGAGGMTAALLLAPQLAAIGALAALVTDVSVVIERMPEPNDDLISASKVPPPPPPPPPPSDPGL